MRLLSQPIDIIGLPDMLSDAVIGGCVYVRIMLSNELNCEVRNDD